jgi:uncharacterized membrane protein YeaQ/YmgE (transglycosylase-associated protein family)
MDIMAVIVTLLIGAAAGWLAGVVVEGGGFGLLGNILVGIAGAFIAALLVPRLGLGLTLGGGVVGAIVTSALGAIVLLLIVNLLQRCSETSPRSQADGTVARPARVSACRES